MPDTRTIKGRLFAWAKSLKAELFALARAARDPRTPWLARVIAFIIVAYAASPIDLIPDFIPFFGMIDDLILVPMGIALVLRLIPKEVMAEHRAAAIASEHVEPTRAGFALVVGLWVVVLLTLAALTHRWWK